MRLHPTPVLALALLGAAGTAAASDPAAWLLKVSEASRHANYQGVVVYHDPEVMETLRVAHRFKDGREQERMTSLSGSPRDVLREDDHVTCILQEKSEAQVVPAKSGLFPAMSRATLEQLAEHYELRDLGSARVAGRECRGVAIVPRDEYRYGYHVWADAQTAVPLKVSLVDQRGRVVEEYMFTEIAFPSAIPDSVFQAPEGARQVKHPPAGPPGERVAPGQWAPDRAPPGFRVAQRERRAMLDGSVVDHVLFTDGLSAVSVFRARMELPANLLRGASHMGAMRAYGRMIGGFHVTVVGEVPPATVRLIADGVVDAVPAALPPAEVDAAGE